LLAATQYKNNMHANRGRHEINLQNFFVMPRPLSSYVETAFDKIDAKRPSSLTIISFINNIRKMHTIDIFAANLLIINELYSSMRMNPY
jgi:hypothetical protein